jgi:4a-hydroxytetrahydrobiopterin dehydratase
MWQKIEQTDGKSYLYKEFTFKNFVEAFAFITKVAIIAEKFNHHPDWSNVYNVVKIKLNTHSKGNTISAKDEELAAQIDLL